MPDEPALSAATRPCWSTDASKKLCSGKGINTYKLKLSFDATGPLDLTAEPCVAKGVAEDAAGRRLLRRLRAEPPGQSGAALLYLLFTHDMRAST